MNIYKDSWATPWQLYTTWHWKKIFGKAIENKDLQALKYADKRWQDKQNFEHPRLIYIILDLLWQRLLQACSTLDFIHYRHYFQYLFKLHFVTDCAKHNFRTIHLSLPFDKFKIFHFSESVALSVYLGSF